jgi:protein TonB
VSAAAFPYEISEGGGPADLRRWVAAFLVVAALHGGVALVALNWRRPVELPGEPPAAVMVDLAPLPTSPNVEEILNELPLPEPAQVELPDPVSELELELPEPPPVELPPEVSELALDLPEPAEVVLPEPPPPMPAPPPPRAKPKPPTRRPPPPDQPVEQVERVAKEPPSQAAPQPAKSATAAAPDASRNSEQAVSLANAPPSWQGAVLGKFQRALRYPRAAQMRRKEGTATILFRVGRNGDVLGVRLIDSSGAEVLDEEAVAVVERVSPLPPPPPEMMTGTYRDVAAPIIFALR